MKLSRQEQILGILTVIYIIIFIIFPKPSQTTKLEASSGIKASPYLININTANAEELTTLEGIGPATAKRIIEYREKNGDFKSIEDLDNVSGIGNSIITKISDFIKF